MQNELVRVRPSPIRPVVTARDVAAIFFRQQRTIFAVFAGVFVLAALAGVWQRTYEAHMKFLVLRQRNDALVTAGANAPAQEITPITEEDLNSEVELLHSDDLLQKVVVATNLQHRASSWFSKPSQDIAVAAAVRKLDKDLHIEPLRKTNVIELRYRAKDPAQAVAVLNAVAAAYMEKHREVHRPSGEFRFFDQQTAQYEQGFEQAQARLAEFTRKHGVVDAHVERDLALQRLFDFDASAHAAQASAAESAVRIKAIQNLLGELKPRLTTTVRRGENTQLMQQLKTTLLNLELKRTELLTKYDPSFRPVQEVDQQIAEAKAAIANEQSHPPTEETVDNDAIYAALRGELAKSEADLRGNQARAAATGAIAGQYRTTARTLEQQGFTQDDLLRAEKTQEENYLLYLRKREEARISDALDQRGILNVAVAELPVAPHFPAQSLLKTTAMVLMLSAFAGLGTGFIKDHTDPCFRTPDELASYLDLPVLGALPKADRSRLYVPAGFHVS